MVFSGFQGAVKPDPRAKAKAKKKGLGGNSLRAAHAERVAWMRCAQRPGVQGDEVKI
jgi:hypothetical protein